MAKEQGERLHDGYSKMVEHGIAIGWNLMEFARMGWADEARPGIRGQRARSCRSRRAGCIMAGDQITSWSGWQEGALLSAHAAVKAIQQQTQPLPARRG